MADSGPGRRKAMAKTPLQKEVLEASYQLNQFPSEEHRRALGQRIGLTESQVQVWFGHRRRKKPEGHVPVPFSEIAANSHCAPKSSRRPPLKPTLASPASAGPRSRAAAPSPSSQLAETGPIELTVEQLALLELAKGTLEEPYRPDGPPLSFHFDTPTGGQQQGGPQRTRGAALVDVYEDEGDAEDAFVASLPRGSKRKAPTERVELTVADCEALMERLAKELEELKASSELRLSAETKKLEVAVSNLAAAVGTVNAPYLEAEAIGQREMLESVKLHEAERVRSETERMENEKNNALESMEKDRLREEAKASRNRLASEKDARLSEVAKQREVKKEETRRQLEEKRRERELLLVMQRHEQRAGLGPKGKGADAVAGPPDDLDLELLLLTAVAPRGDEAALDVIERPEFPPPSLALHPAFHADVGDDVGADVIMAWSFLNNFSEVMGLPVFTLEELVEAVRMGERSALLPQLFIPLIRVVQADMEEAHATGASQSTGNSNFMDRGIVQSASLLEEAWAWGFDVDAWRAHLGPTTWPEILRELAIVAYAGGKRPRCIKESKARLGQEGEDLFEDAATGEIKLRMPQRFAVGTVKAAAWQVLSEEGPAGLVISEVARRIQKQGLRDLSSSKTPEASIGGSLSRDRLFVRVAPATYTLYSVAKHYKKLCAGGASAKVDMGAGGGPPKSATPLHASRAQTPGREVKAESAAGGEEAAEGEELEERGAKAAAFRVQLDGAVKLEENQEAGALAEVKAELKVEPVAVSLKTEDTAMAVDIKTEEPASAPATAAATAIAAADTAAAAETDGIKVEAAAAAAVLAEDSSYSDEEEDEEEIESVVHDAGEPWVTALLNADFDGLEMKQRIASLSFMCHLALDGPTVRAKVDFRIDEGARIKKQIIEDAKNEKKNRLSDVATRLKAAADEASRKMEELQYDAMVNGAEVSPSARAVVEAEYQEELEAANYLDSDEAERVRLEERMEALFKADVHNAVRMEPLGMDRRFNRYWQLRPAALAGASLQLQHMGGSLPKSLEKDPNVGRIWVESAGPLNGLSGSSSWRLLTEPSQLAALKDCLDVRGMREGALHMAVANVEREILAAMSAAAAAGPRPEGLNIRLANSMGQDAEQESMPSAMDVDSAEGLDEGMKAEGGEQNVGKSEVEKSEEELFAEKLATLSYLSRLEQMHLLAPVAAGSVVEEQLSLQPGKDPRSLKLKRDLLRVEGGLSKGDTNMEKDNRLAWAEKVEAANSPTALRDCLSDLEISVMPGRVSPYFAKAEEMLLVYGAWHKVGREVANAVRLPGGEVQRLPDEYTSIASEAEDASSSCALAWLPPTYSALALRLSALDAAIMYGARAPGRDHLAGYKYVIRTVQPTLDAQEAVQSGAPLGGRNCLPDTGSPLDLQVLGTDQKAPSKPPPAPEPSPPTVEVSQLSQLPASSSTFSPPWLLYGATLTFQGHVRSPVPTMLPQLPPAVMAMPRRDFEFPMEPFRSVVEMACASGVLDAQGRPSCSGRQAHIAPQIIKARATAANAKARAPPAPSAEPKKRATTSRSAKVVKSATKSRKKARGDEDSGAEDYGPGYDDGLGDEDDPFGLNQEY